jgi:hypothetical protein
VRFTVSRTALLGIALVAAIAVGVGIALLAAGDGDGDAATSAVASTTSTAESVERKSATTEKRAPAAGRDDCASAGISGPPRKEGTCVEGLTRYVVVNRDSVLELATLDARLLGVHRAANGSPVTFDLEITNRTRTPARFDQDREQVVLYIDGAVYSQKGEVQQGAFVSREVPIQPGGSLVGTVSFEVPSAALDGLGKTGNLDMSNLGIDGEVFAQKEIGTIRIYK